MKKQSKGEMIVKYQVVVIIDTCFHIPKNMFAIL